MITVALDNGTFVKALGTSVSGKFGFHPWFGFISESRFHARSHLRKKTGKVSVNRPWAFRFSVDQEGSDFSVRGIQNCQAESIAGGKWKLVTPQGAYILENQINPAISRIYVPPPERKRKEPYAFAAAFVLLVGLLVFWPKPEEVVEEKKVVETVTVKVMPRQSVQIPSHLAKQIKTVPKDKKVLRAVQQNLGFLGLVGKKNLKNAVGGVPTQLKEASAGAGPGGLEGSGGEVLVGLGKGLHRVTVGNSGVKGLGGVGTKGRGGGKGGYGDALVGSGEGAGMTSVAMSNDMILQGGLDRNVVNATIAKYINQVRACYERGLQRNPALNGLVSMAFEIGASGMLNFAKVGRSSLGDSRVENCIQSRMMTWKFPKPVGGVNVKVKYPFLLRPVRS